MKPRRVVCIRLILVCACFPIYEIICIADSASARPDHSYAIITAFCTQTQIQLETENMFNYQKHHVFFCKPPWMSFSFDLNLTLCAEDEGLISSSSVRRDFLCSANAISHFRHRHYFCAITNKKVINFDYWMIIGLLVFITSGHCELMPDCDYTSNPWLTWPLSDWS